MKKIIEVKEEVKIGNVILEEGDKIEVLDDAKKPPQMKDPNADLVKRTKEIADRLDVLLSDIDNKSGFQKQASSIKRMISTLKSMRFV